MNFFKYTAACLIVFTGMTSIQAMPPHPDVAAKLILEGRNGEVRERIPDDLPVPSINKSSGISRSYPSSGTVRVPVLFVVYGTPYPTAGLKDLPGIIMRDYVNPLTPLMLSLLLFLMFALFEEKKFTTARRFAPVNIFIAAFLVSCGVEPSEEEGEIPFPTDLSVYSGILNGSSPSDMSAKKYFSDMSNGNLNVQFDFYGPVQVSKTWQYYGTNSGGNDAHPGELVGEAVRLMVSKYSNTNFSIYDQNNDGKVDSVIIIHEGPGEESGAEAETIWSHEYDLYSAEYFGDGDGPVFTDGVWFNTYAIVPEYTTAPGDSTIGVFCHEFGHVLGLPDLYDTSDPTETDGAGDWSLMGSGSWSGTPAGSLPAPLLAWERIKLGGTSWVTLTTLSNADNSVSKTVTDIETSKSAYKVLLNSTDRGQYLIIEGKSASAAGEWTVPGTGILITHIHEGIIYKYWDNPIPASDGNRVNYTSARAHGVNILEADGGDHLWTAGGDEGSSSDLFAGVVTLNDGSNPSLRYYSDFTTYLKAARSNSGVTVNITSSTAFNVIMP